MTSAAGFFTVLAGILAVIAGAVYFFGIPREWKRAAEEKALETMGENKASYVLKDQISKLPASDQEDVKELQKGLGNALGGTLQNPLGKFAGDTADGLTSPFTGR
ncbi:hypothetical protein K461DRAFT_279169 [Myriangium duriaei CBS 260.36]|uniref:Uncharacterized protein n=1 Tax=Myriangium duriaei CBS 260.36 TaxID=1168546 RepID=A0A9P4J060_9PEZI|nr:hypothetical protein K461DRAFT_279169 [Myriangium duriaei CBS 260.36]